MPPEELLRVKPLTTVEGVLEYSERTMRTIANVARDFVTTTEPRSAFVRRFLQELEPWYTVEARGKMTKRIAAYLHDQYQTELPAKFSGAVGSFLNDESPTGKQFYDQTNQFNWREGDFGDHGSCFMVSRRYALEAMMEEGGHALRFWKDDKGSKGIGRAWVMNTPLGLPVIFNAYGPNLESFRSRLKLIVPDAPTTIIRLSNMGESSGGLYINGGVGLLVGSDDEDYEREVDLNVSTGRDRPFTCPHCGNRYPRRQGMNTGRGPGLICEPCLRNHYEECQLSGVWYPRGVLEQMMALGHDTRDPRTGRRRADLIPIRAHPDSVRDRAYDRCQNCQHIALHSGLRVVSVGGVRKSLCWNCAYDYAFVCTDCGAYRMLKEPCYCGANGNRITPRRD